MFVQIWNLCFIPASDGTFDRITQAHGGRRKNDLYKVIDGAIDTGVLPDIYSSTKEAVDELA